MEMVGEEEKGVESSRSGPELWGIALVDDGLGGESFDPGEWGGIGEAEVVGEEEDKGLVVGFTLEKSGPFFALMAQMIILGGLKVS